MSLILDLGEVSTGERSRLWHKTIKDNYLDLDIKLKADRQPLGTIAQSHVGSITFAALQSVPQSHERTTTLMNDDVDHLLGWLQFRGRGRLDQCGRETTLKPGEFLILDCGQSYQAEFPDDYQIFIVKVPRVYFLGAFAARQDFINVGVGEREGGMIIVDHFRRLARNFNKLAIEDKAGMSALGVRLMVDAATGAIGHHRS